MSTVSAAWGATLEQDPLTASDRCDRCSAQAYVRAIISTGGQLLFCVHHAKEHRPALEAMGAAFHDESKRLDAVAARPD